MKQWTLYEHSSPSGKIYVGITSWSVEHRWEKGAGYVKCKAFYNAIKKYGWDNIKHNIIATNLGEMTAKNMEKDLIAFYKERGISYNITNGGDGIIGVPRTKKQREHAGNIWRGKKIPRDIVEKGAAKRRGIKLSAQHIENIKKSKLGNKNGNKKLFLIKDGVVVREFDSCVEAAKELGTHPNCISRCCRGENKTWHGFTMEYAKREVLI